MAIVSTYSVGSASTTTLSYQYSTLDELLVQIPDNTANQIDASDVRDSVYTLWKQVESLGTSLTSSMTASVEYIRSTQSTNTTPVGGVSYGSTFTGTVQDVLDRVFYGYSQPTSSLLIGGGSSREFGQSLSTSLSWSVVRKSIPITSISVGGVSQTVTGNSQSGTQIVSATYSYPPSATASSSFGLIVNDGTSVVSTTQSILWYHRIFWGSVSIPSHPNLTINPGSASLFLSVLNDSGVRGLDGADANGLSYGTSLSGTKNASYIGINGSANTPGEYLVFAWPSNFAGSYTPTFTVNGMLNNSFTRIRTNSALVANISLGYSTNYEVWVSNTRYYSPVNVTIS
jgi:hypothetical protein